MSFSNDEVGYRAVGRFLVFFSGTLSMGKGIAGAFGAL
jgi:hypothetical protein